MKMKCASPCICAGGFHYFFSASVAVLLLQYCCCSLVLIQVTRERQSKSRESRREMRYKERQTVQKFEAGSYKCHDELSCVAWLFIDHAVAHAKPDQDSQLRCTCVPEIRRNSLVRCKVVVITG
jgi:hypothetical protein